MGRDSAIPVDDVVGQSAERCHRDPGGRGAQEVIGDRDGEDVGHGTAMAAARFAEPEGRAGAGAIPGARGEPPVATGDAIAT